jgi:hypothetical protein
MGVRKHERQNGGTLAGQETVRNHHRLIDGHVGTSDGIVRKAKGETNPSVLRSRGCSPPTRLVARNQLPILVRQLPSKPGPTSPLQIVSKAGWSIGKTLKTFCHDLGVVSETKPGPMSSFKRLGHQGFDRRLRRMVVEQLWNKYLQASCRPVINSLPNRKRQVPPAL